MMIQLYINKLLSFPNICSSILIILLARGFGPFLLVDSSSYP